MCTKFANVKMDVNPVKVQAQGPTAISVMHNGRGVVTRRDHKNLIPWGISKTRLHMVAHQKEY